ncbi:MAG: MBL fold metallo-hydrolase [Saprospiraceae bacterium]|nr:MBL fold metallo-hydrolase [Saprospiraceae bacterium]
MNFTFLGTGTSQGVPIIGCDCEVCTSNDPRDHRLRCSLLVSHEGRNVAIDAGPDFRQQMLRAGVRRLDAVVLTHEHNDHIIGLDDVRPFIFMQNEPMPLYATDSVIKEVKQRFSYAFEENPYPGAPQFELRPISKEEPFEVAGIPFQPIEVLHGSLPVLGFRIGDFAYLTDMKTISPSEKSKLSGIKTLVVNALHLSQHHSHMNLEEALTFIEEVRPEQAWLTHISHSMGLHAERSKLLPKGVGLAWDGLAV